MSGGAERRSEGGRTRVRGLTKEGLRRLLYLPHATAQKTGGCGRMGCMKGVLL